MMWRRRELHELSNRTGHEPLGEDDTLVARWGTDRDGLEVGRREDWRGEG